MRKMYKSLPISDSAASAVGMPPAIRRRLNEAIRYSPILHIVTSGFATNGIHAIALSELAALSEDRGECRPSEHAHTTAKDLMDRIYAEVFCAFPKPMISPDGDNGILLDWASGTRSLRLVLPDTPELQAYLYHQDGNNYDAVYDLSSGSIKQWLTWLIGNEPSTKRRQPATAIDVRGFALSSAHR